MQSEIYFIVGYKKPSGYLLSPFVTYINTRKIPVRCSTLPGITADCDTIRPLHHSFTLNFTQFISGKLLNLC